MSKAIGREQGCAGVKGLRQFKPTKSVKTNVHTQELHAHVGSKQKPIGSNFEAEAPWSVFTFEKAHERRWMKSQVLLLLLLTSTVHTWFVVQLFVWNLIFVVFYFCSVAVVKQNTVYRS